MEENPLRNLEKLKRELQNCYCNCGYRLVFAVLILAFGASIFFGQLNAQGFDFPEQGTFMYA